MLPIKDLIIYLITALGAQEEGRVTRSTLAQCQRKKEEMHLQDRVEPYNEYVAFHSKLWCIDRHHVLK